MQVLAQSQWPSLRPWFSPEQPGPVIYPHTVQSGYGRCLVDRWPDPRTVIAEIGANYALRGDPGRLGAFAETFAGFVQAPPDWLPVLRDIDPGLHAWERLIFEQPDSEPPDRGRHTRNDAARVRRLAAADADAVAALSEDVGWIANTWGGAAGMAAQGRAFGAFIDRQLVSVAVPFFVGERYEDIGVVTEPEHRGLGLSAACAARVAADIRARGRRPTWSTSPSNRPSVRVAKRLGFRLVRNDVLYLIRTPVPDSAFPPGPGSTAPPAPASG